MPRQTVASWVASADGIRQSLDSAPLSLKRELADQAAGVIRKALYIVDSTLEHYIAQMEAGEYPKPSQLRGITVTAGISRDIHLDYTDGRKGAEVVRRGHVPPYTRQSNLLVTCDWLCGSTGQKWFAAWAPSQRRSRAVPAPNRR